MYLVLYTPKWLGSIALRKGNRREAMRELAKAECT
jgi:hypothetical protein